MQHKLDSVAEECMELAKELQKLQVTNRAQITDSTLAQQNQSDLRYVHQLDLGQYYDRLERVSHSIEAFVQNNFKTEV